MAPQRAAQRGGALAAALGELGVVGGRLGGPLPRLLQQLDAAAAALAQLRGEVLVVRLLRRHLFRGPATLAGRERISASV